MVNEYSQALTEVYEIIKNSNSEVRNRIPYRFKKYMYKNMDKNYNVVLDKGKRLTEQEHLQEKSKDIVALIYRDYLTNYKEREKLINEEIAIAKKIKEDKLKKFDYDNLFKKKVNHEKKHEEKNQMITTKKSLLKKIIIYIKGIINKGE